MSTNLLSNNVGMTVPIQFKSYLTDVTRNWYGSTSSSDGTVLAACVNGGTYGYIYISTDSGVNWTVRMNDFSRNWSCIACSRDGSKMVAGIYGGFIYTSIDYGLTWSTREFNRYWVSLASSSDGVNLVACTIPPIITTSITPPLITPTSISHLQLWLDATDFSIPSGSSVTTWNDKSGNGYNASIFVGSATYNSTGFNNLPAIQMISGGFRALSPVGTFSNGITYFVVYQKNGAPNVDSLLSKTINGGIPAPFITERRFRTYLDVNGVSYTTAVVINFGFETGINILSTTINSSTWNEYKNGEIINSINVSTNFLDNGEYIYIGTRDNKTSYTTAVISEVIVYNRVLTTVERQNVEGYLATKWNLPKSLLSVTHPYYYGGYGYVYTSTNSGVNWTATKSDSSNTYWSSVVSSSNGSILAACAVNDNVYISYNYGVYWTQITSLGSKSWSSLASSSDGTKLVACVQGGFLYTSTNSGVNWTDRMTDSNRQWYSLYSSSDGNTLFAGIYGGQLYTSTDSGVNWIARDVNRNWSSVACSSDATTLVAFEKSGFLYTLLANDTTYSQDIGTIIKPYISGTKTDIGIVATIPRITSSTLIWTSRNTGLNYRHVASSKDGTKLIAGVYGGYIYTSTNSGATWTPRASSLGWYAVASSSNGKKLVAGVYGGYIYTSSDSGANWSQRATSQNWYSIASSSNGTKLVACVNNELLYISTDSGANWRPRDSERLWTSVASSSDGTKLVACVNGGTIYTSINSGLNWFSRTNSGSRSWTAVASSSNGTKLVACVSNGTIYTSADSGGTWAASTLENKSWTNVTSSEDGTKLAACASSENIYTSTDSGTNWLTSTITPTSTWFGIASSSDGNKLILSSNAASGLLYTSIITTTNTTLDIGQIYQPYASGTKQNLNIIKNSIDIGITFQTS